MARLSPLRIARVTRGLPLREVAAIARVDIATLSKVERGIVAASPSLLARIVHAIDQAARDSETPAQ